MPETPAHPGLFLDPDGPEAIGQDSPALAARPTTTDTPMEAASGGLLVEDAWRLEPGLAVPAVPVTSQEPDASDLASGKAALAGLAVAAWGSWWFGLRMSDRDGRRRPAFAMPTR